MLSYNLLRAQFWAHTPSGVSNFNLGWMLSVCLRFQVLFPHMLSDCYFCCEPPGGSDGKKKKKKIHLQCRKHRLDPGVGKIPWRRKWQPTPVFLSGKFHGQRSLEGYSPWCCKESDTTEWLSTFIIFVVGQIGIGSSQGNSSMSVSLSWL